MSKYPFKNNQRYAVYKAFDGICQWCKERVDVSSFHVDHVLPEELLNRPEERDHIFKTYGLPAEFNINDYENWTVLHPQCNLRKSAKVYEGVPIIKTLLDSCQDRKELEQRTEMMLNKEPKKAEVLARVQAAIDLSVVNINELQNFILKTNMMDTGDEELEEIRKGIEQRVEYQTEKMVTGIVGLLTDQTRDVANSIAASMGGDWRPYAPMHLFKAANDTKYGIIAGVENKVDPGLIVKIVINPDVIDQKLVVTFRELTKDNQETFADYTQDLEAGIDWEEYKGLIRRFIKERLKNLS
jgi:hypothetical protein